MRTTFRPSTAHWGAGLSVTLAWSAMTVAAPATRPTVDAAWPALAPHPRLLVGPGQFERVRAGVGTDPVLADLRTLVLRQADAAVMAKPIEYVDGPSFMLFPVRAGQGRIVACAMAYRLTGERKYFDAARRELLALAALPDWCPRHYLDVGEAAFACGIGLDWLHDDLAEADRATIAAAIVNNALRPSLTVPDEKSWVTADYNWNPVCHGGLSVGALAVAEREPELARRVVERAVANVPHAAAAYAPDGTFPEGPSYWLYGTTFYVLLVEALRSSLHEDFGLMTPGVLRSIDYLAQVRGPSGEDFDYADYHGRHPPQPLTFWFARELRRGEIAAEDVGVLRKAAAAAEVRRYDDTTDQRMMPMQLLWWDGSLPATAGRPLTRHYVAGGAAPLAVFRSAWDDKSATFVAMKGGTPNGSHAHMDVGGFVLEADGVRWAIDLGTENYNKIRAAKVPGMFAYDQDSGRWTVFRNGPEAHNILRFDGRKQNVTGFATVKALPAAPDGTASAEFDLSGLYAGQAAGMRRTVSLHPDRSVTIADRWTGGDAPGDVAWQWLTRADVAVEGNRVTLRENDKTLTLAVAADGPIDVRVEDVSRPRAAQDSPNPGVRRISVRVATPARASAGLTVRAIPGSVRGG